MMSENLWNDFLKLQLSIFYWTKIILLNRVFCIFDQYTTHFSVHPVSWKIMYELCQNNAPRKLWKFNIPGIYWMFSFIILQDIYFTCLTLSTGIPIESLYIYKHNSTQTYHHGQSFLYFKNKRKKNSYMFQTKYLN